MKETQLQWTIRMLEERGEVTRNQALGVYFSRLASRIDDLKQSGWKFREEKRGGDYAYILVSAPKLKQMAMV